MAGIKHIFSTVVFLTIVMTLGCGGGVTGTGGTRFEGKLLSEDGTPIGNVAVSLSQTDQMTQTDATGAFVIESPARDASVSFLFNSNTVPMKTVTLTQLPADAAIVQMELVYTNPTADIRVASLTFAEE